MKWNERFTHLSTVDVKWRLMKLFFTNDREMRWNGVKFMKFSETRPWEPTKRFMEFYQKSVLVDLFPHLKDLLIVIVLIVVKRRHLHERVHTYQVLWILTMECPGNSSSCTPWTRDSSGAWQTCESPRLSDWRASQTQPTWLTCVSGSGEGHYHQIVLCRWRLIQDHFRSPKCWNHRSWCCCDTSWSEKNGGCRLSRLSYSDGNVNGCYRNEWTHLWIFTVGLSSIESVCKKNEETHFELIH
jgi:hypothetical protein